MQRMEAMQEEQAKRRKHLPNMIDDTIDEIEHDIDLIGATAIEDKLQKDVPDTIASLAVAGIKIWILTGDKQDTAINIGFACQLLRQDMDLHIVNGTMTTKAAEARKVTPSTMHDILRRLSKKLDNLPKNGSPEQALVIDGVALEVIFHDSIHLPHSNVGENNKLELLKIASRCKAVVACRVSPQQKALMVTLVKENNPSVKTLSIGDGANDVPMIMAANIGVGIKWPGRVAGCQRKRLRDCAIFHSWRRLLLVHGRFCYRRASVFVVNMFYKNILVTILPFVFSLYNVFSTYMFFPETPGLLFFNASYTAAAVVFFSIFDEDIPSFYSLRYPILYRSGPAGGEFSPRIFWGKAFGIGTYHAVIIIMLLITNLSSSFLAFQSCPFRTLVVQL